MAHLSKCACLLLAAIVLHAQEAKLSLLELLENTQNDLSGGVARGHLSSDERSKALEINGVLAVNLGQQRAKKPKDKRDQKDDKKELKNALKEILKLVKKGVFERADADRLESDIADLDSRL